MSDAKLPDDVREALLRRAKQLLLGHYIDGRKRLEPWDDFRAGLMDIQSYSLPGSNLAANRKRLSKLVDAGLLIERTRCSGVRSWTAPRPVLDEIGTQVQRELEAVGYRVGVLMEAIEAKA